MDIAGARVCILCPNDMSYVVSQWAVWMAGGVAVPLSPSHPSSELEYFISDSGSSLVIVTEDMADKLQERSKKHSVPLLVLTKEDYLTKNGNSIFLFYNLQYSIMLYYPVRVFLFYKFECA